MINIEKIRTLNEPKVVVFGNHQGIIQSVLDFDYLSGKKTPGIIAVVGVRNKYLRFFYGDTEITIPGFVSIDELGEDVRNRVDLFTVAQSGRRAAETAQQAIEYFPNAVGGMIFAEDVPEKHAIKLRAFANLNGKFVLGPASVGMTVGGVFKLGAIGGTLPAQIAHSGILVKGSTAIISTSGGMINEIISLVSRQGTVSFAAAVGGERFPLTKPVELVEEALRDEATDSIVFFGELGGRDEYEIAELLSRTQSKKPFVAYIAGVVAEKFEAAPQFGHAKALAQAESETASAKKRVLKESGAMVADSFAEFEELVRQLPVQRQVEDADVILHLSKMTSRKPALFHSTVSSDKGGEVKIIGEPLVGYTQEKSLSEVALSMFIGHIPKSTVTADFFDMSVKLLVDHGPQVSGAVNTMISARAGVELPAALASGLLTVGPRFGGAINQAAIDWLRAVSAGLSPEDFVEDYALRKQYISGIGHKKYRVDNPDPRVTALLDAFDRGGKYTRFAKGVAGITTGKKAQLILNVDGAVAALLLDIFADEERYSSQALSQLVESGFCNAIFVYARSIGFIAHYLDQKRQDEPLFRLPDSLIN